jgi:hypothetical protein
VLKVAYLQTPLSSQVTDMILRKLNKLTTNKFFLRLLEIHNFGMHNHCVILNFSPIQQKEFITMLMRYGWKGGNLAALYKVIQTINHYRKNMTVTEQPLKDFCNFGNKILEFARFLMFQNFRDKPMCIFNYNTTEKLWYCIKSIDILEKLYIEAEKHSEHYIFNKHKDYLENLVKIGFVNGNEKKWSHRDDYILVS